MSILYVVATPIGNLSDMTPRGIEILSTVDMVAAEDTRHSRGLLTHFGIKVPMYSCHKFNEEKQVDFFIKNLAAGKSIALISDAGTPCISDPGHRLVGAVADAGFTVVPICGVSAVVGALSVAGFDVSKFTFVGFLPRKAKDMVVAIEKYLPGTVVFYESPKRILATLENIAASFESEIKVCLCNDLTKKYEKIYHGNIQDVIAQLQENPDYEKGEYTCVIYIETMPVATEENAISLEAHLVDIIIKNDVTLKEAGAMLKTQLKATGKKEIYAAMLNIKQLMEVDHS